MEKIRQDLANLTVVFLKNKVSSGSRQSSHAKDEKMIVNIISGNVSWSNSGAGARSKPTSQKLQRLDVLKKSDRLYVTTTVQDEEVEFLINTGANIKIFSEDFVHQLKPAQIPCIKLKKLTKTL